jgi:hypothetical protein
VHDTANIETAGIPMVYVATVEFTSGAVAQAKALGVDPAVVYTEHPIQDRTDEEMIQIADKAFEGILGGLVKPS